MSTPKTITLGSLRTKMAFTTDLPDDTPVMFGAGDLSLCRLKDRGGAENLIQFEFNEIYSVTLDPTAPD